MPEVCRDAHPDKSEPQSMLERRRGNMETPADYT
jgi:hypothetical protein